MSEAWTVMQCFGAFAGNGSVAGLARNTPFPSRT